MRGAMPGLAMLPSATAGAQTLQLGEVGRWYLVLAPMHDAQACITYEEPLRPGLEAMLRDIHRRRHARPGRRRREGPPGRAPVLARRGHAAQRG
jgi:hypothetical protein